MYLEYNTLEASQVVTDSQTVLDNELEKETPKKGNGFAAGEEYFSLSATIGSSSRFQVSIETLTDQHKCLKLPNAVSMNFKL